jgi:hypothetical protein
LQKIASLLSVSISPLIFTLYLSFVLAPMFVLCSSWLVALLLLGSHVLGCGCGKKKKRSNSDALPVTRGKDKLTPAGILFILAFFLCWTFINPAFILAAVSAPDTTPPSHFDGVAALLQAPKKPPPVPKKLKSDESGAIILVSVRFIFTYFLSMV